jgi:hypothetical protein
MTTEDAENTERENDLQCELAAWELLREAKRELAEARARLHPDRALEWLRVHYQAAIAKIGARILQIAFTKTRQR